MAIPSLSIPILDDRRSRSVVLGGKGWHRFAIAHPQAGKRSAAASFCPPLWPLAQKTNAPLCGA